MGSRFLKKTEAAQMLGVCVRSISNMIKRGALRPIREGQYVGVWEEDVLSFRNSRLKRDGERTFPIALNRETINRLDTEVRVLRQELDQVLRVLNIRRESLKVSDLEMVHLYETAAEYASKGWPPQVEEQWANYFLRLQTDNFRQVEKMTKDAHPWRPFLKLVSTMQHRPYNTELALQLSAGRDHLTHTVSVWFELKRISPLRLDSMIRHDTKPSKHLLNSLAKRQKNLSAKA